jgi:hypothetical protein
MSAVVDLAEVRAEKAGIITPLRVINEVQEHIGDIVAIAVVGLLRDGRVVTSCSTVPSVTLLGMLELAKDDVLYPEDDGE